MLHMEILRAPYAHARIVSIDASEAQALPGVVAVVTGELLAQHNLAWMPTLSGDTQAVLATDKVRFQGQEVACVIAETAYIAKDALELIDVEYDPLDAVTNPQQSLADGAPLIRDEKEGQTTNHVYHWESGDADATEQAFAEADTVVASTRTTLAATRRRSRCCGCIADVNPATGKATIYMTSQAPHAHRTLFAIVAGLPEHQIRIICPDLGGGFGNKVPIYPGYVVATAASLLLGRPVKWVEDRTGNLISTGFARDYHMRGELAVKDGKMTGLRAALIRPGRLLRGCAAVEVPRRSLPHRDGLLRHPRRARRRGRRVHEQGTRRRRVPLLVPRHRGLVPDRAARRQRRHELGVDPARVPARRTSSSRSSSRTSRRPASSTTRATTHRRMNQALERLGYDELRREQAAAREEGRLLGIGLASFTEVVGAGPGKTYDIAGLRDVRLGGAARPPDRQGDPQARRQVAGPGPRDDVRPDRRGRARHPVRGRRGAGGRHRQHALRARHVREPLDPGRRAPRPP